MIKYFVTVIALLLALALPAQAQITVTNTFVAGDVIYAAQVNTNFTDVASNALNRAGGTITGNIAVSSAVTIDGIDISAFINQAVLTTSSPTFVTVTANLTGNASGTAATVTGATQAAITSAANLVTVGTVTSGTWSGSFGAVSGTNLTGLAKLASSNTYTAINKFLTYSETKTAPTISGGTLTINLALGTSFVVPLNAAITTLTISNPVTSGEGGSFMIRFTADGTVRAITWPASIKWLGAAAPSAMTGTVNRSDIVTCVYDNGGTSYFCAISQNFSA